MDNRWWRRGAAGLAAFLLLPACGGGGSGGSAPIHDGEIFSVAVDPSTGQDSPFALALGPTYAVLAGNDYVTGSRWRIEKRSLADGSLLAAFGTGGVVTANPSAGYDAVAALAIDATFLYAVGSDQAGSGDQWRIEKRALSTGALDAGFGSAGVVLSDPSSGVDQPRAVLLEAGFLYIAGGENNTTWRIEKRSATNGALDSGFGTGGVISLDLTAGNDVAEDVATDGTSLLVAGTVNLGGDAAWRVEKRALTNGALDSGFATSGVLAVDPTATPDRLRAIAIAGASFLLSGSQDNEDEWRLEKRAIDDAALDAGFGTGGVLQADIPSSGTPVQVVAEGTEFYVAGSESGAGQWRLEQRDVGTGVLVPGIGEGGVWRINWGPQEDLLEAIAVTPNAIYLAGSDTATGLGSSQWRFRGQSR